MLLPGLSASSCTFGFRGLLSLRLLGAFLRLLGALALLLALAAAEILVRIRSCTGRSILKHFNVSNVGMEFRSNPPGKEGYCILSTTIISLFLIIFKHFSPSQFK